MAVGAIEELAELKDFYIYTTESIWKNISALLPVDFQGTILLANGFSKGQRIQAMARKEARRINAGILFFGFEALWLSQKLRPDLGLNQHYYRIIGCNYDLAIRPDVYKARLKKTSQIVPQEFSYRFIHDFPKTNRDIQLHKSRLLSVHADTYKNYNVTSLMDVILAATELHLVNSSIYCFSLAIGAKNHRNCLYLMRNNYLVSNTESPGEWEEFNLYGKSGFRSDRPELVDRQLELDKGVKMARKLTRLILNRIIFGRYGSHWNPVIEVKIK